MLKNVKIVVVASRNPVKIRCAETGFQKMFPNQKFLIEATAATSGVSDQPKSHKETLEGAMNRAQNVKSIHPEGHFWVGIEGGIESVGDEMKAFAWIVILTNDLVGKACTSTFFLPPGIASLIRQGKELGEADDLIFGLRNSKQKGGAVGILTNNVIDRTKYYTEAVILALIPFKNRSLFT